MTLAESLDRLADHYAEGGGLAVLCDYDGTLSPIVPHPSLAWLPEPTAAVLRRLGHRPRMTVGILSGRALDDLKAMLALSAPEGLPLTVLCGSAGSELEIGGRRVGLPGEAEARQFVAGLTRRLSDVSAPFAEVGVWVEAKPLGLTVHYRDVPAPAVAELAPLVEAVLAAASAERPGALRTHQGPAAWEVFADLGATKGTALRTVLSAVADPVAVLPLYAGDAENDADALSAADAADGVAVGVGPAAPPVARFRVAGTEALREMLEGLADRLEGLYGSA
jgi:trehalose-phosphatase